MKRIGIDVDDKDHARVKRAALRQNQTIANYIRLLLGLPLGKQGERKDLHSNGLRKKIKKVAETS